MKNAVWFNVAFLVCVLLWLDEVRCGCDGESFLTFWSRDSTRTRNVSQRFSSPLIKSLNLALKNAYFSRKAHSQSNFVDRLMEREPCVEAAHASPVVQCIGVWGSA